MVGQQKPALKPDAQPTVRYVVCLFQSEPLLSSMVFYGPTMCTNLLSNLFGVATSFRPFQPKIDPLGRFVKPKGYFSLFWPLFGPCRATFGAFWVWQLAQTGLSGCLHWCSNLVLPFQPKIGPLGQFVWSKDYFQPILTPFWSP